MILPSGSIVSKANPQSFEEHQELSKITNVYAFVCFISLCGKKLTDVDPVLDIEPKSTRSLSHAKLSEYKIYCRVYKTNDALRLGTLHLLVYLLFILTSFSGYTRTALGNRNRNCLSSAVGILTVGRSYR
jgi:hypothetical protein